MKHVLIKEAIPKVLCEYLSAEYRLIRDNMLYFGAPSSDPTVPGAFAMYSPICFETLSLMLHPKVQEVIGRELYPSYTYARIYVEGCELKRHKDRLSSEYSVTCCLSKDGPWAINFEYDTGVESIDLEVGDMLIFQGTKYLHWREKYTGKESINAFLMYVDANGPWKHYKYDGRPMLGMHFSYAHPDVHAEMKKLNNGVIK